MSAASQPSSGEAGIKPEALGRPQKRRKGGVLGLLTKFMPTNYNMVVAIILLASLPTGLRHAVRLTNHSNRSLVFAADLPHHEPRHEPAQC